ncbi:MAG: hypothetical protein AAF802_33120, partial [Planctomycetota bacterium]
KRVRFKSLLALRLKAIQPQRKYDRKNNRKSDRNRTERNPAHKSNTRTLRITRRRQTTNHSNNRDFAARRVSDGYGTPSVRSVTAVSVHPLYRDRRRTDVTQQTPKSARTKLFLTFISGLQAAAHPSLIGKMNKKSYASTRRRETE